MVSDVEKLSFVEIGQTHKQISTIQTVCDKRMLLDKKGHTSNTQRYSYLNQKHVIVRFIQKSKAHYGQYAEHHQCDSILTMKFL